MSSTRTPGIKAAHAIITDNCRKVHANGAGDVAWGRIRGALHSALAANVPGDGTRFHIVVTVERASRDG